jgi:ribonuclease Z
MTSSIRILTTYTLDSSPAILLVSPNGDSTLINCGEGCQRSFLESPGLRTKSVKRVCLTHIAHDAIGGLPGMVLTTADVAIAAAANVAAASAEAVPQSGATNAKRKTPSQGEEDIPGIDIVGPRGTQAFLHSLRHFMRRDKFRMRVNEGAYKQAPEDSPSRNKAPKPVRKKGEPFPIVEGFYVETLPLAHRWAKKTSDGSTIETEVLSFIFTTPPIAGKFLADKAKELGVPRGPLYAKLKKGECVTFEDDGGVERTVESHQVVAKGHPGVAVAVIYCPSLFVWQQLEQSPALAAMKENGADSPVLDVIVHMTSHTLFHSPAYRNWMESFTSDVDHMWLESVENLTDLEGYRLSNAKQEASPFRAASMGAQTRSLLHAGIFPSPISLHPNGNLLDNPSSSVHDDESSTESKLRVINASPLMNYILIPRSKKGISKRSTETTEEDHSTPTSQAEESGALELAKTISSGFCGIPSQGNTSIGRGELIFTGTGSAIPCKQRNVTGMYLQMTNGNGMLLDSGEGTLGQLLRATQSGADYRQLVESIKAVWISHPHADHHLGLLRFLTERNDIVGYGMDPVVLMAPPNLFWFLAEYSLLDPSMSKSFLPLDCRDMDRTKAPSNRLTDTLFRDLGITRIISVPVAHCPHSYAVVIDGTPFGRVAYSGDCRPSLSFADAAIEADLLIHEATFEDGMEDEATLKRHCTVGEALRVGERMRAKAVALTHFSQRYPRIPPLGQAEIGSNADPGDQAENPLAELHPHILFAFDFMKLTPDTVAVASALTPALRLLYPSQEEGDSSHEMELDPIESFVPTTKEILSVPGLFAQKDLL